MSRKTKKAEVWKVYQRFVYDFDDADWADENGNPVTFPSEAEANKAIDELIRDTKEAAKRGDMAEAYYREDYMAVKVN